MSQEIEILQRRLNREKKARKEAERILEERSLELYHANEKLKNINQNLEQEVESRSNELFIQEKNYRQVVENVPDIIYRANALGFFTFVNKIGAEKTGYSQNELLQKTYIDLVKSDFKEQVRSFYKKQHLEKRSKSYFEFPIITKNGDQLWIGQNVQYVFDNNGNITEVFAIARDITEFKFANEQLKISEEKYRSIIENLDLGLLETTIDGIIVKAYSKFLQLTGYSANELLGKDPKNILLRSKDEIDHIEKQEQLRRNGIVGAYEAPIYKKNGEIIWVIISAAPIYNKNGEITGTVGVHFDITKRKKIEEELKTARLDADNARKAEQLFLANMSHELRTPLNAVIGMAHLLYDLSSTQEQIEYLNILQNSANLLKGIINDILDISKIEAGKLEYNESIFNIYESIRSLRKTFELKVQGKPVSVNSAIDSELEKMLIKSDSLLLNQIFLNLLSNAEKFTAEGNIGIDAYILKNEAHKVKVLFKIYDSGIGIDEKRLPLIFEKYEQANQETKMKYGGTGLGLSITKKIIDFLNGEISVESTVDEGTVFKVILDFNKIDEQEAEIENETPKHNLDSNAVYSKILVVEDNAMNRKYLHEVFKNYSLEVDYAFDGQLAIDKCIQEKYDLIFMDLQMPVKDGFEATVEIRLNSNPNHNTPIVALSAYATEEVIKKCELAGMDDFISKPVTPSQLKDILNIDSKTKKITPQNISDSTTELDQNVLEELYFGDESYAFEMFDHFLQVIDQQIEELKDVIRNKDWKESRRLTHKIKPGFSMVGLPSLQEICSVLETACELENENEIQKQSKNLFIYLEEKMQAVINEHKRLKDKI
ncbi:MAG: PAS domain S-box protein [Bacteroidia bacterium]